MVRTVLKSFNAPFGNKVVQKMDLASDMGGGRSCAIGMVGRAEPAPSWVTEHLAAGKGSGMGVARLCLNITSFQHPVRRLTGNQPAPKRISEVI